MTSPSGLLDFFVLEASDYVEKLDGLLAAAGPSGPDAESFTRFARMLRGSATMARVSGISELSAALERVGRALRDRALAWEPALGGAVVAAVDDLKILVRGVRTWGSAEEQRAQARLAELTRYAPQATRSHGTPSTAGGGFAFLAGEAAEIAAGLDQFVLRPDPISLVALLGHVRALRGVAAIKDLPPLADVVEAIERAAKPLELGAGQPSPQQLELFSAAARLLGRAAVEMRNGGRPDPNAPEIGRFVAAAGALDESAGDAEGIVPIAQLYFEDAGPHVVAAAPNPPTTPPERFRLEAVSQAEHLRRLVADARSARDAAAHDRLARELRGALRSLRGAAAGFGEHAMVAFVDQLAPRVAVLEPAALDALDEVATLLATPGTRPAQLAELLASLAGRASAPAPAAPAPAIAAPGAARTRTPAGGELRTLLQTGIAGINRLAERPLSQPVPIVEDGVVPIDTLVYRGRAALERAIVVRDALREQLRASPGAPSREALDELFDLLDLAASE